MKKRESWWGEWGHLLILAIFAAILAALIIDRVSGEEDLSGKLATTGEKAESAPTGRLAPLESSESDSAVSVAGKSEKENSSASQIWQNEVGMNLEPADIEKAMVALVRLKGKISQPLYEAFEYAIEVMRICAGRLVRSGEVEIDPDAPIKRSEEVLFLTRLHKLICRLIEEVVLSLQESDKALAETQRLQSEINLLRDAEQGTSEAVRALQAKLGALSAALAGKGEPVEGTLIERASQALAETAELRRMITILTADVRQHPNWDEADKRLKAAETALGELSEQVVKPAIARFNEALARITEQEEIAAKMLEQRYHELLGKVEAVERPEIAAIQDGLAELVKHLDGIDNWQKAIEEWRKTVVTREDLEKRLAELEAKLAGQNQAVQAAPDFGARITAIEEWQKVFDEWRAAYERLQEGKWLEQTVWNEAVAARIEALEARPTQVVTAHEETAGPVTSIAVYHITFSNEGELLSEEGPIAVEEFEKE